MAAAGGTAAFALSSQLARLATLITVLDAAGLGLFAVTGASKALGLGLGAAPAVILGAVTGVGGGTLRDVLLGQIPSVLRRGLYAIPALCAAVITVAAVRAGIYGLLAAAGAVLACFLIRVLGVRYDLNAPMAPDPRNAPAGAGERNPRSRARYRQRGQTIRCRTGISASTGAAARNREDRLVSVSQEQRAEAGDPHAGPPVAGVREFDAG